MSTAKKVAFHTLGCKLNFAETSSIARTFETTGYQKVDFSEKADIYVINTCSVTNNADKECRQIVRGVLNNSPDAFIAIIGCYAQLKPEEIAGIEGVDLVLGASEKFNLPDYIAQLTKKGQAEVHACEIDSVDFYSNAYSVGDRTRAFLKVQDGCDYSCTFCTIPLARGKSRSDSIENVIRNAQDIAAEGVKEIVLTGVNIGDFGKNSSDDNKHHESFFDLVKELDKLQGIERVRISSIEPNLLKDEIIEFVATSQRYVPHFHIPLQSGSDKTLKRMRRRYLSNLYADRVRKIKSLMPHCCIGVDVIVGFPGETDEDFMETYNFLNGLDISYLHVFTYSERDHTEALKIAEVVPHNIRKERNKMLRILSVKKQRLFYEQHIGNAYPVLMEGENKDGFMHGYTPNYIKVKVPFDPAWINQVKEVEIAGVDADGTAKVKLLTGMAS